MWKRRGKAITVLCLLLGGVLGCSVPEVALGEQEVQETGSRAATVRYALPVAGEAAIMSEEAVIPSKGSICIATIGSPYTEILEEAQELLKKKGYELKIAYCKDYGEPNEKVLAGEADGNFFQHTAYLERYNLEKGTSLKESAIIYFQPLGIYPGQLSQLKAQKENMKILVPESVTGYARALFLLQQEGFLILAEDADLMAVEEDVVENPHNIILVKTKEDEIWEKRQEADFIICNPAYVLSAGAHPQREALAMEKQESPATAAFGQSLVTLEENQQKLIPLVEVLCSSQMKNFITSHYKGSIQFQGEILREEEVVE